MSIAEGKTRIQVTFSDTLLGRLDEYAERTGISRSACISFFVGSALDSYAQLQAAANQSAARTLADMTDGVPNESGNVVI